MRIKLLLILLLQWSPYVQAQWNKYEVVPLSYRDTSLPQWADMDQDGLKDLVGYDKDLATLFYRTRGVDGFISNEIIEEIELRNGKFIIVDWDGDGDSDVVVEKASSFGFFIEARIYFNEGDGEFSTEDFQMEIEQFVGELSSIADMDGDDFNEIIIEHSSGHYLYALNGSGYALVSANEGAANNLGVDVSFSDLDTDGRAELIDVYEENIDIYSLENESLVLLQVVSNPFLPLGNAPTYERMRFHDLDGDGDIDMCRKIQNGRLTIVGDVGSYTPGSAYFCEYLQNDDGLFESNVFFETVEEKLVEGAPYKRVDENNFSYAIYDEGLKIFDFVAGMPIGTFTPVEQYDETFPIDNPERLESICISDIEDGRLYAFEFKEGQYELALSSTSLEPGNKFNWINCDNCSTGLNHDDLALGDLDLDGDADIVIASIKNRDEILWIKNYRNGCRFDTLVPIVTDFFENANNTVKVELGDLDSDGDQDLVIMEQIPQSIPNGLGFDNNLYVVYNQGDGIFSGPEEIVTDLEHGFEFYVEDIYKDGYSEIIVHTGLFSTLNSDLTTFSVSVLENGNGIENYSLTKIETTTSRGHLEFGDLDNDGDTDLVIYSDDPFNEVVSIYFNDGSVLALEQEHSDFVDMFGMELFDYDGDGLLDVLAFQDDVENNFTSSFFVFGNVNGVIDFINPEIIYGDLERCTFETLRNEDGSVEMIGSTLNPFTGNLQLYGEPNLRDTLDQRSQTAFILGDINGDGFDDILSGNVNGELSFYTQGEIDCDPTLSSEDLAESNHKIFPNPTSDFLNIESGMDGVFYIYSIDGRLLKSFNSKEKKVDVSDLGTGIYFLKFEGWDKDGFADFTEKLVIE